MLQRPDDGLHFGMKSYKYRQAETLLPLLKSISNEIHERWKEQCILEHTEIHYEEEDLNHADCIADACVELEDLGIRIVRRYPLSVRFPATQVDGEKIEFSWIHGDKQVNHVLWPHDRDSKRVEFDLATGEPVTAG